MITNSKIILISLLLMTLLLLGTLFFGVYSIRAKSQEASEIINMADNIARVETLAQFVETVQTEAGRELQTFDHLVITSDKLVPLIENIEGTGQELGLGIKILSVDRVENKKSNEPPVFTIVTETEGSWISTFSFLSAMEQLPARVMFEEFNLSKAESGWQSRIVLSLHSFD